MSADDLNDVSLLELFRTEADNQVRLLTTGLLALERNPTSADQLESCMRAAHSLKGAARIVGIGASVSLAHAMEECFVAAQRGEITLTQSQIDKLLKGVDLFHRIAQTPEGELDTWDADRAAEVNGIIEALNPAADTGSELPAAAEDALLDGHESDAIAAVRSAAPTSSALRDQHLRVTAEHLNHLLGLASESLVESRWVQPFAQSLLRVKRVHHELLRALEHLREAAGHANFAEPARAALNTARVKTLECQLLLSQRLEELDTFDRRVANLSQRLYDAALACRMRPFADGVRGLPRMVRDLARALGKQARLEIIGEATSVDRDILEQLEAPLAQLLRNAVDHGLEHAEERGSRGKTVEGVVRLEAHHAAGRLRVIVADDGRGIDVNVLRAAIVERNLINAQTAQQLREAELFEFLFLPGFTMKSTVTEISGRGVGLDVVQDMLRRVRGSVTVSSERGQGTRFELQLPLTLSVMRVLLVEVNGEPYAIPLAHIDRTLKLSIDSIDSTEGRRHFELEGERIGLVTAHQALGIGSPRPEDGEVSVIVLSGHGHRYALVVDRLLAERQLVVQPLDARFGKIKDVAAGALLEDGSPLLVLDVEDLVRTIEKLVTTGAISGVGPTTQVRPAAKRQRVLVIDDSLTVRELERKLLASNGYDVEVAVDGLDGWNAVRTGDFNLVITDVDMPRMNGIELVTLIKKDPQVNSLPVMIVSYKDRPEDRRRGLEAGADYYLAKGSFHDDTLIQAVKDLIGGAQS
jgi:two-component system, chemotaxis family, sensor histidine kinase and response regulator WspE